MNEQNTAHVPTSSLATTNQPATKKSTNTVIKIITLAGK